MHSKLGLFWDAALQSLGTGVWKGHSPEADMEVVDEAGDLESEGLP